MNDCEECGRHLRSTKFDRATADQWDWFTLYDALGRPGIPLQRKAAVCIGDLARSLRRGDSREAEQFLKILGELDLKPILERALSSIKTNCPRLSEAISMTPISDESLIPHNQVVEAKSDDYIMSQIARAKLERANAEHKLTLSKLVDFLQCKGFVVERSRLVDAFCRLKTGPAIFEVKSITPSNERGQCRQALSQLYEYRYLHSFPEASLWLVLSSQPRIDWITDYLQSDRDIGVLWLEGGYFSGPGVARLLD